MGKAGLVLVSDRNSSSMGAHVVVAEEEQRDRAGADVRAGDRFIADGQHIFRRFLRADQRFERLRAFGIIRVRDAHDLILRVAYQFIVFIRQRANRVSAAAHLADADDLAAFVSL